MEPTSVTGKGQTTIPKAIRQKLGIRKGTKVEFSLVGKHAEMRVVTTAVKPSSSGFGLIKTKKAPVPVDFDAASILSARSTKRAK
jgi:AbrB family looped-hinge helix DNA binding protein